ncbi:enoyl-CoA hydratase/isomerase family protein [Aliihoeflea sp. PC F10.4]
MSEGRILTTLRDGGCLEITIDRPNHHNILTATMTDELSVILRAVPDEARSILFRGSGVDFCGGRVSPMPDPASRPSADRIRREVAEPVLEFYDLLRLVPVPVIAAVRGRAYGVGCALAALADVVIADETARFCVPELDRDIPPLLVMTACAERLTRAGLARMVFSREPLGGVDAMTIGLVSQTCRAAELENVADKLIDALSANSPHVLATIKRFLNTSPELPASARRILAADSIATAVQARFT